MAVFIVTREGPFPLPLDLSGAELDAAAAAILAAHGGSPPADPPTPPTAPATPAPDEE